MHSRGKPWRKTQVLFSFEEQGGKQLSDPSCLPPGRARAGIHQVFPAMNVAAGLLEPGDTPGLKMELCFCFETCLGLCPSTSVFPSNFLSWKKGRRRSPQLPEQVREMTCLLKRPCCGHWCGGRVRLGEALLTLQPVSHQLIWRILWCQTAGVLKKIKKEELFTVVVQAKHRSCYPVGRILLKVNRIFLAASLLCSPRLLGGQGRWWSRLCPWLSHVSWTSMSPGELSCSCSWLFTQSEHTNCPRQACALEWKGLACQADAFCAVEKSIDCSYSSESASDRSWGRRDILITLA